MNKLVSESLNEFFGEVLLRSWLTQFKNFVSGLFGKPLKHVVIAVDISGSISMDTVEDMIDEMQKVLNEQNAAKTTILFFDEDVDSVSVQNLRRGDSLQPIRAMLAGGGTNYQAPINWISNNLQDDVSLLVIMTDGMSNMPERPPYPVLWIVFDNTSFKAPFGKTIFV